ncbi:TonB-dependent receptor [Hyunsoonleella flava]|uniref:TonB-dependent receptor n=1 Tax=Hyunsoonleella flava TaxID=2527939 RepID=A0A4Q9FBR7_9FLAO|nr:TonB-dependent receptor [Hyunsoonleella flava]TBN00227.1 TonB-dependent receptor [Hyunsoonleella flava]
MKQYLLILLYIPFFCFGQTENAKISGKVTSNGIPIPFASVYVKGGTQGVSTDENGIYKLTIPAGKVTIIAESQGYRRLSKNVSLKLDTTEIINFSLVEDALGLNQVVVSATRNRISKKEAPVIVKVLSPKLFKATQSLSLADGLNYQPGVRVETNCQNCGFTQVRLNGLEGQYTQILVNSRPVFSALNGVYGLEQIPVSIIDRLEVVRSGGSALFGSNAIAGTINVITKEPINDTWEVNSSLGIIDCTTADRNVNVNASVISEDLMSGITVYGIFRDRDAYDANGDGFTEITELNNNSLGTKAFLRPNDNSKIGFDFTGIREYRRGGDKLDLAPQFTDITEELDHNTIFTSLDYELFNDERTNNLSVYTSLQYTNRDSYYGGLGGGRTPADSILANNAFGVTKDIAFVAGTKFSHEFTNNNVITTGLEYQLNDTDDAIAGYNRLVDQSVKSLGIYGQYEWKPTNKFSALIGARLDHVDVDGFYTIQDIARSSNVSETVLSPRFTILYNISKVIQFRGGYARGFRAPQAFNEDLHISSVGGEQRFVILSDNLESEFSNAYTASFNFTKDFKKTQTNLLVEGFYTTLKNPFTIVSTGSSLANGSILEESRNGSGAFVAGTNIEMSVSPNPDLFFQAGATFQKSIYKEDQILFEADGSVPGEQDVVLGEFTRAPNVYGFLNSNWQINDDLKLDVTGSYTGTMVVPRVISDSGFIDLVDSKAFFDMTTKLTYHFDLKDTFHVELSGGVQNLFNSYQNDFDTGAGRDSDYVYGPNRPRTLFIGLKFGDF